MTDPSGDQRRGPRLRPVLRRRVTPADVGARVTVRRWVPDPDRGRIPSDVVGHLRSWAGDRLVIVTRDGTEVDVDAADVVASRVIPEPPPRP